MHVPMISKKRKKIINKITIIIIYLLDKLHYLCNYKDTTPRLRKINY